MEVSPQPRPRIQSGVPRDVADLDFPNENGSLMNSDSFEGHIKRSRRAAIPEVIFLTDGQCVVSAARRVKTCGTTTKNPGAVKHDPNNETWM